MNSLFSMAMFLILPLIQAASSDVSGEVHSKVASTTPTQVAIDLGALKANQIVILPFVAKKTGLISSAICRIPGMFMLERPAGIRAGEKSQVILFIQAAKVGPVTGSIELSVGKEVETLALKGLIEAAAATPSIPALPARIPRSYDASLYLDVAKFKDQASHLFCDIRHFQEVQAVSLPGALTFRLEDLRSTPQFRDRQLILIGGGTLDHELEADCRRLRHAGYASTYILRGGLAAWSQGGGHITGSSEAAASCSPLDAILARDYQQTVFVNACTRPVPPQLIRETISPEAAAKLPPGSDFIVLTDAGKMSRLPALPGPTFLLSGGLQALEAKSQEISRMNSSEMVQLSSHRKGCGCQ